jgi:band 4.1-like protein 5
MFFLSLFQDINDNSSGLRSNNKNNNINNNNNNNNNYDVSPWLVSSEIVQATKSKDPPIIRKSVITTQL